MTNGHPFRSAPCLGKRSGEPPSDYGTAPSTSEKMSHQCSCSYLDILLLCLGCFFCKVLSFPRSSKKQGYTEFGPWPYILSSPCAKRAGPVKIRIFCPKTTKFSPKLAILVILGQALPAHLVPCWWVGWRLWRAGCISQDTYVLCDITK